MSAEGRRRFLKTVTLTAIAIPAAIATGSAAAELLNREDGIRVASYLLEPGLATTSDASLALGKGEVDRLSWLCTSGADELNEREALSARIVKDATGKLNVRGSDITVFDPDRFNPAKHYDVLAARVSSDGKIMALDVQVQEGLPEHEIPALLGTTDIQNLLPRQIEPYDATLVISRPTNSSTRPDMLELVNGESAVFDEKGGVIVVSGGERPMTEKPGQSIAYHRLPVVTCRRYDLEERVLKKSAHFTFEPPPLVPSDSPNYAFDTEGLRKNGIVAVSSNGRYIAFTIGSEKILFTDEGWVTTPPSYVCIADTKPYTLSGEDPRPVLHPITGADFTNWAQGSNPAIEIDPDHLSVEVVGTLNDSFILALTTNGINENEQLIESEVKALVIATPPDDVTGNFTYQPISLPEGETIGKVRQVSNGIELLPSNSVLGVREYFLNFSNLQKLQVGASIGDPVSWSKH